MKKILGIVVLGLLKSYPIDYGELYENKELRNIYKKINDQWATKYAMSG